MIKLSKRLQAIADFINKNDKVIDVGCDHGYLSIYLADNIGCKKVIASDVNQNALNSAIKNINNYNLNKKIDIVLSDGLQSINTSDYNTIVISGMGTSTILKILDNPEKLKTISKLIIQSNNDHYKLRKELIKKGFVISNEKIVFDKKYYIIIEFNKGIKKYSKKELEYGPFLLCGKESINYFQQELTKLNSIYNKLPNTHLFLKIKLKNKVNTINKIIDNL